MSGDLPTLNLEGQVPGRETDELYRARVELAILFELSLLCHIRSARGSPTRSHWKRFSLQACGVSQDKSCVDAGVSDPLCRHDEIEGASCLQRPAPICPERSCPRTLRPRSLTPVPQPSWGQVWVISGLLREPQGEDTKGAQTSLGAGKGGGKARVLPPADTPMVRRGSTVRVRQRASLFSLL